MAGMLRMPRSRGGFSGLLLIVLGIWGGLVPFAGPAFHYGYSPATAWTMTGGRLYLELLPAIGVVLGGMIVLGSRIRPVATLGACLAAASGAWFAVGGTLTAAWAKSLVPDPGVPLGGSLARAIEQVGMFSGLGVAVTFLAALAFGRLTVIAARDTATAGRHAVPASADERAASADTAVSVPPVSADTATAARPVTTDTPTAGRPEPTGPVVADEPAAADQPAGARPQAPATDAGTASGDTALERTPTGAAAP